MREKLIKKQWLRKGIAMVIALAMVAGILPVVNLQDVFAEGEDTTKFGTVEVCTGGTITGNTTSDVKITVEATSLNWSGADDKITRYWDAWWAGINVYAPNFVNDAENFQADLDAVKFTRKDHDFANYLCNNAQDTVSAVKDFSSGRDSQDTDAKQYIGVWIPITPKTLADAIAANSNIYREYVFYWKGVNDQEYKQTVHFEIVPSDKIVLNHVSADEYSSDDTYHWKYCTCCTGEDRVQMDKAEHTGVSQSKTEPTETTNGVEIFKCSVCEKEYTVTTAPLAPTSVDKTDCTTYDNNDGTITGVSTDMEYRNTSDETWTPCSDNMISALVPGNYEVRRKQTETAMASGIFSITINAKPLTEISNVAITGIDAPVAGSALDIEAVCNTDGVASTKPTVEWKVGETKAEGTTAGYGTTYTANITLEPKYTHAFINNSNGTTATVEGATVKDVKYNENGTITVSCEFLETDKLVSNVAITDITAPVAGEALDTVAGCVTQGVSSTTPTVEWKVNDVDASGNADYSKEYTAHITLTKADSYVFNNTTTATVNGKRANVAYNNNGTITVSYTFPATAQYIPPYIPPVATSTPEPTPTPTPSPEPTETPAPSASAEPSMEPISEEVTTSVGKEVETVVEEIVKGTDTTVVDETTATKIKEAVEQGKDIETEIVAEPVSEEKVDATEAKAIEETVKSLENTTDTTKTVTNVAQFINIEILIKAGGEILGNLTALKEPIKLKIAIPENLKADSRKFFVVRLHNGKVEKLDSVMNEDGTLTFSTDKFSTYALAYEDTVEVEKTVGKTKIGSTSRTTSSVTLPWSKVAGATKYRVYYKVNGAAKYTMVADTTALKYTVKGLKSATTYKFAVKAFGYGKWSDVYATKITTTSPDKVSTVTATPGSRKATVKYSKVARATGYEIYMAKGNGKYVKVKTTKSNSYVKTGLAKGATYKFRVRAFKKVGTNVYYGAFSSAKYAKVK